jgi:hypothetical protein
MTSFGVRQRAPRNQDLPGVVSEIRSAVAS